MENGWKTTPVLNWEMGVAVVSMYTGFITQSSGHYMLVSPNMENFDDMTKLLNIVGKQKFTTYIKGLQHCNVLFRLSTSCFDCQRGDYFNALHYCDNMAQKS